MGLASGSVRLDSLPLVTKPLMPVILNRMKSLKRLCLTDIGAVHAIPFIRQFADQLTMLDTNIRVSDLGSISFPNLTQLHCQKFDATEAAAFPFPSSLLKQINLISLSPSLFALIKRRPATSMAAPQKWFKTRPASNATNWSTQERSRSSARAALSLPHSLDIRTSTTRRSTLASFTLHAHDTRCREFQSSSRQSLPQYWNSLHPEHLLKN